MRVLLCGVGLLLVACTTAGAPSQDPGPTVFAAGSGEDAGAGASGDSGAGGGAGSAGDVGPGGAAAGGGSGATSGHGGAPLLCAPGQQAVCACASGAKGAKTCWQNGQNYGPCDCQSGATMGGGGSVACPFTHDEQCGAVCGQAVKTIQACGGTTYCGPCNAPAVCFDGNKASATGFCCTPHGCDDALCGPGLKDGCGGTIPISCGCKYGPCSAKGGAVGDCACLREPTGDTFCDAPLKLYSCAFGPMPSVCVKSASAPSALSGACCP